jgi:3-oxoadipate enol-lactonase
MNRTRRCGQVIAALMVILWRVPVAAQSAGAPHGSLLDVDGGKLYYEECGAGPRAIVLVHDGVLHSAAWDDVWPDFCKHFHAIRYDRLGYGRSPAATTGHYAADDIAAILRHLNVKRVAVVGSSHGGEISINFIL